MRGALQMTFINETIGSYTDKIFEKFKDKEICMRNGFGQVEYRLRRAVERCVGNDDVAHVNGKEKHKQQHGEIPVQQKKSQPLRVEKVVDCHPRAEVRRDGKPAEDNRGSAVPDNARWLPIEREVHASSKLELHNMQKVGHQRRRTLIW